MEDITSIACAKTVLPFFPSTSISSLLDFSFLFLTSLIHMLDFVEIDSWIFSGKQSSIRSKRKTLGKT